VPKAAKNSQKLQQGRISIGPPATANINRPGHTPSHPSTPQPLPPPPKVPTYKTPLPASPVGPVGQAEFAPNAFSAPPQYANTSEVNMDGNWYDRVLDLLLGEDETSPRNRIALICHNCRLINGQAPPGTKSLMDLGKWRCFGCGSMNGEEDEAAQAVKEMKEKIADRAATPVTASEPEPEPEPQDVEDEKSGTSGDSKDEMEIMENVGDDSAEDLVEVKPRRGRSSRKKV